ncbi:galactose-3-O-sulfotransferase 3 [Denticeps clupeoides]|uniref:Galactose-3-O-sulfotransferase 3 n=1 Tax=Denticeps clupeoides TaxID=299321 RepID=A0AAY3ZU70_9TELE|nr:galactose-3-O-sulfotransferase 3 [Denticeps clupeoides]
MSQKKIFLVLVAISTVSLLLHHGGHLSWTMEAFSLSCPALRFLHSPLGAAGNKAKHTSIAFLKTHKTASTTVQNMLFRFAERHNLTVALPVQTCDHQFCYPHPFSGRFVHPHTTPADIITSHMRLDRAELRRLMPNDTTYVTILREPAAMFESLFSYYNQHCLSFRRVPNGSLEAFLDRPWSYYRPEEKDSMYARNTLTFDLGGDKDRSAQDAAYVRGFVDEVERTFSLVMIAEYFDESLVLLRRLLAWDLEDVLYLKLNMRTPASKRALGGGLPAKIRAWNSLDAALYDHFNASLWRQLGALGAACVAREVRLMRRARGWLVRDCFGGPLPLVRSAAQIKNKDLRPWQPSTNVGIVGYDLPPNASRAGDGRVTQDVCTKLVMPEVQYSRLLLRSQLLRYRRSYPPRNPRAHQNPPRANQGRPSPAPRASGPSQRAPSP